MDNPFTAGWLKRQTSEDGVLELDGYHTFDKGRERHAVADAALEALPDVELLTALRLRNGKLITDRGMEHVVRCSNVSRLCIDFPTQITPAGILRLRELKELRDLQLTYAELSENHLRALGELTWLNRLSLFHTEPPLAGLQELLKRLLGLTKLDLAWNGKITDVALRELPGHEKLQHLRLDNTEVTDAGVACLDKYPDLTRLDVSLLSGVTGAGVSRLSRCSKLAEVFLISSGVTKTGLDFNQLPGLHTLCLNHVATGPDEEDEPVGCVTDAVLESVGQLKGLATLYLADTPITDAGLAHLIPLNESLVILDLSGTKVTDAGLRQLRTFRALRKLRLNGTNATLGGVWHPQTGIKALLHPNAKILFE
jgi:hypothetical protein